MIKIAIANKSQHLIETLMDVLPYKILWVAYDCEGTLKKAKENPPDLILLDVSLPLLGAISITKELVENQGCSVILTTSDIGMNSSAIFESMGKGASDVISLKKYRFDEDASIVHNLIEKIETIENLLGKRPLKREGRFKPKIYLPAAKSAKSQFIAIGASTGGPVALSKIVSAFPQNVRFSVVIVQHIDQLFVPSLVSWLNDYSKLPVEIAEEGAQPKAGTIYIAARNEHLTINHMKKFEYVKSQKLQEVYAPSIDLFFESLAENWDGASTAILLTGMGNDGAKGLKKLHDNKWVTIVQSEETCVVFGMPKTAIQLGGVSEIVPLEEIGPRIVYLSK
jgi:two-component system, chemotaxis family, response regulator WspF